MTAAFTFPGQGSQAVGMGKALADAFPAAKAVFDEVDAALGEKLTAIIWDGPAETLQLTENAQPALMAVSIATLRVLESEAGFSVGRNAAFVAGHSLGEYSALAAAGSLTVSDTARLLRTRGLAMQKAVPVGADEGALPGLLCWSASAWALPCTPSPSVSTDPGAGAGRAGAGAATARCTRCSNKQEMHLLSIIARSLSGSDAALWTTRAMRQIIWSPPSLGLQLARRRKSDDAR